jgi:hypothetical protein
MQRPFGLTIICIFLGVIYFWGFLFKLPYLAVVYLLISAGINIGVSFSNVLLSLLVSLLMLIGIIGLWNLKKWALFLLITVMVTNLIRYILTQPLLLIFVLPFYIFIIAYLLAISKRFNGVDKIYYPYYQNNAMSKNYKPRARVKRWNKIVLHVKKVNTEKHRNSS